jgi:hypothetical protein
MYLGVCEFPHEVSTEGSRNQKYAIIRAKVRLRRKL